MSVEAELQHPSPDLRISRMVSEAMVHRVAGHAADSTIQGIAMNCTLPDTSSESCPTTAFGEQVDDLVDNRAVGKRECIDPSRLSKSALKICR